MIIYTLQSINKHFFNADGDCVAKGCDEVTLDIQPGAFLAITGESGSGKSTLLSLLGFLASPNPLPSPGQFLFSVKGQTHDLSRRLQQGIGSRTLSRWRADHIGFVFQNFHLLNHLTGRANVELGLRFAAAAKRVGGEEPQVVLDSLGMGRFAHKRTQDLSGGQKQRISVARALIKQPEVILADEPTGNLDTANKCLVLASLLIANKRFGTTVVLVTHEIEHPPRVADRSVLMRDGKILAIQDQQPTVIFDERESVVDLAQRIARDCYPGVYDELKWD